MIGKDLIEIYKDNLFLLKVENQELWFSLNKPLQSIYYGRKFAILTAWNPNNIPTTDLDNVNANHMLQDDLLDYDILDSTGKYKDHYEDSFLVYDISLEKALALGIKYNQYSVFYNDTNKLSYIECKTEKILVSKKI